MEGPTGIVVMFLILIGLSLVGKLITVVSNFLTNLEKQARERMKQMEAERRAMSQGGGGGDDRPRYQQEQQQQPPANELEQLFQMLTGQAPAQQPRPQRPRPQQRAAPPPPMPRRPTRRIERAPELDEEGRSIDEGPGHGEEDAEHGGHLADRHLLTRVEARVPRVGVADRHIAPNLSSAAPPVDESERQAKDHAAADMIARIESLPPLARGVLWSELLGQARWKTGERRRRNIRQV